MSLFDMIVPPSAVATDPPARGLRSLRTELALAATDRAAAACYALSWAAEGLALDLAGATEKLAWRFGDLHDRIEDRDQW